MKKEPRVVLLPLGTSQLCVAFLEANSDRLISAINTLNINFDAAMFQAFAAIEPTSKGIVRFREENSIDNYVTMIDSRYWLTEAQSYQDDPVQNWPKEILDMRRCIELWEMIRSDDMEKLGKIIKWESDSSGYLSVIYDDQPNPTPRKSPTPRVRTREVIASESDSPRLMRKLNAGDTVGPAKIYLKRCLNDRLEAGVRPRMFASGLPGALVSPFLTKKLSLTLVPQNFVAESLAAAFGSDRRG